MEVDRCFVLDASFPAYRCPYVHATTPNINITHSTTWAIYKISISALYFPLQHQYVQSTSLRNTDYEHIFLSLLVLFFVSNISIDMHGL